MSKSGMTIDTQDFDKSFHRLMEIIVPGATEKGLVNAAWEMLRDGDKEAPQAPKEFGDLRGSRKVDKPKITRDSTSIKAGYTSKYAARQHETEPGEFNYTTNKGASRPGPKFLQIKMVRHKKKYIEIVVRSIKNRMTRGR